MASAQTFILAGGLTVIAFLLVVAIDKLSAIAQMLEDMRDDMRQVREALEPPPPEY